MQLGAHLTHRLVALAALSATLVVVGPAALGARAARADTTDCTGAVAISTGNPLYAVENSDAPGGSACLTVTTNGTNAFRVDSTSFNPNAPEAPAQQFIGYKAVYTGCKHGHCLEPGYPAQASSLVAEPTNWSFSFPATGSDEFDAVYDMYFNTTPAEEALPTGAELMVWLNHTSNLQLVGAGVLPDVTIEGTKWHVSSVYKQTSLGSWNRIVFERATPTTSATNLDMVPFIHAAEADGAISPDWYEQDLEAGFEIWNGGAGLATTAFSAPAPTLAGSGGSGSGGSGSGSGGSGSGSGGSGSGSGGSGSGSGAGSGSGSGAKGGSSGDLRPNVTLSLPICSTSYSKRKCASFRRTAGAWKHVFGFASGSARIKQVTIKAVRAHKGRVKRKTLRVKAKFIHSTAFKGTLIGLTTGHWTFTATAVDTKGRRRTSKPHRVDIDYGLSPFQHLRHSKKKH